MKEPVSPGLAEMLNYLDNVSPDEVRARLPLPLPSAPRDYLYQKPFGGVFRATLSRAGWISNGIWGDGERWKPRKEKGPGVPFVVAVLAVLPHRRNRDE